MRRGVDEALRAEAAEMPVNSYGVYAVEAFCALW